MKRFRFLPIAVLAFSSVWCCAAPAFAQYGVVLSGAGPINRSMGGASSAPLDASGALYWNPATISGLGGSELEVGAELLYPQARLSSSVGPFSGSDTSDSGIFPLPTMGLVYRPDNNCPWTFGFGLFAVGGFAVNYPSSTTNPILFPQVAKGLGPLSAQLQVMQIVPTVSLQVTDRLSIGFAPTVTMASLQADPFVFASPGLTGYPAATHGRLNWGAGFQAGVYYRLDGGWHLSASVKSPQWFETFKYDATDSLGRPETLSTRFDYPLIATAGVGYTGFERWTLATDFHFINYRNAEGFGQSGFNATGAVQGLGWNNVYAIAAGAQYQCTDCLSLRTGYTFNTDPINSSTAFFNAASPMILQNTVYVGASYSLSKLFLVSVAYAHAFENSVEGALSTPLGAIPGSSVRSTVSVDTVMFGATVKF